MTSAGAAGVPPGDIHDRASVTLDEPAWSPCLTELAADAANVLKTPHEPRVDYHALKVIRVDTTPATFGA
jgi:hypothetical protein